MSNQLALSFFLRKREIEHVTEMIRVERKKMNDPDELKLKIEIDNDEWEVIQYASMKDDLENFVKFCGINLKSIEIIGFCGMSRNDLADLLMKLPPENSFEELIIRRMTGFGGSKKTLKNALKERGRNLKSIRIQQSVDGDSSEDLFCNFEGAIKDDLKGCS
jgi:hypothetical protein